MDWWMDEWRDGWMDGSVRGSSASEVLAREREREERIGFALMGREACASFLANLLRSIAMWEPDRSRFGGLGSRIWRTWFQELGYGVGFQCNG
jgi:hypothetical protein